MRIVEQQRKAAGGVGINILNARQQLMQHQGKILQQVIDHRRAKRTGHLPGAGHIQAVDQNQAVRVTGVAGELFDIAQQRLTVWQAGDGIGKPGAVPGFQIVRGHTRQLLQRLCLFAGEVMRLAVGYAERAEYVAAEGFQRCASIKTDKRRAQCQTMAAETRIQHGIRHHHYTIAVHRITAK